MLLCCVFMYEMGNSNYFARKTSIDSLFDQPDLYLIQVGGGRQCNTLTFSQWEVRWVHGKVAGLPIKCPRTGSSPNQGHCVVFWGNTLSYQLKPGV